MEFTENCYLKFYFCLKIYVKGCVLKTSHITSKTYPENFEIVLLRIRFLIFFKKQTSSLSKSCINYNFRLF